jgi:ribosome-binding factor A
MSTPRRRPTTTPRYPRRVRLNVSLREVIADELVRIDDERLTFVTITAIDVDNEMNRAIVYFDSLAGEEGDDDIVEALTDHRVRLQAAVGRQIRAKKTPILSFRPDEVIRSAERIEHILRTDHGRSRAAAEQLTEDHD